MSSPKSKLGTERTTCPRAGASSTPTLNVLWLLVLSALNPQVSTLHAQGTAFTYQGRLNDQGVPADGSYDLRFKLFLDPFGNTQAGGAVLTNGVVLWGDNQRIGFAFGGPNEFLIRASGAVGIGTSSPLAPLHVVGPGASDLVLHDSMEPPYWSVYAENCPGCASGTGNLLFFSDNNIFGYIRRSNGNYYSVSDERLKRDISPLNGVLERVMQLRPVSYHFRDEPVDAPRTLGLIAQAVEPVFPEVVGECHGMKSVAYGELVPAAIGAIQELNRKLTGQLEQEHMEIGELKRKNESLEKRLEALERHFQNQELN